MDMSFKKCPLKTYNPHNMVTEKEFFHEYPKKILANNFCEKDWVTLYKKDLGHPHGNPDLDVDLWLWTYLVDDEHIGEALKSYDADLRYDERGALYADNSYTSSIKDGFESTVVELNFYDTHPIRRQIRINEEFIYMFHLYEEIDNDGNKRYSIFDAGEEKTVLIVSQNEVRIKHRYLNDFLSARKMNLVCVVRSEVNMTPDIANTLEFERPFTGYKGITNREEVNTITNFSVAITGGQYQSWLKGKKVIRYKNFGEFKSSFDNEYAEFIIGYDSDFCREKKLLCCDEEGKNKRTFFRRSVLEKYRDDPKASVEPFSVSSEFFSLKCNTEHPDVVWAFLKDLRNLPYSEQLHWVAHNKYYSEELSQEYKLNCYSDWSGKVVSIDYKFRNLFNRINIDWEKYFGWRLFKPTKNLQSTAIKRIFILGENNSGPFRKLLELMNLVLTESINVTELKNLLFHIQKGTPGIALLNSFLESKGICHSPFIHFLRQLNTLRSQFSDVHRNGEKTDKHLSQALDYVSLDLKNPDFKTASINLFEKGYETLANFYQQYPILQAEGNACDK